MLQCRLAVICSPKKSVVVQSFGSGDIFFLIRSQGTAISWFCGLVIFRHSWRAFAGARALMLAGKAALDPLPAIHENRDKHLCDSAVAANGRILSESPPREATYTLDTLIYESIAPARLRKPQDGRHELRSDDVGWGAGRPAPRDDFGGTKPVAVLETSLFSRILC